MARRRGQGPGLAELTLRVLVVNAGSSSLKLRALDSGERVLAARDLPAQVGQIDSEEVAALLASWPEVDAIGHRIVHGGERFRGPVRIDDGVERELRDLAGLAPLHQAKSLAALDAVSAALSGVPAVACFDTAFHATLPPAAATYALPAAWRERYGLRRYGFHGLSHAYASRRAAELLEDSDLRLVSSHLGSGASLAAVEGGRSVDTTMGFTPLEGLVMGTRSGSVDPGLLLWLLEREAISETEMATALEHDSGLLGLAGSADMREVIAAAEGGSADALLGLDVYLHRLRGMIAAMAVSLGDLDALVFTGGVGENSPLIRARAVDGLGLLGLAIDRDRNEAAHGDASIGAERSASAVLVIEAREDIEIARQVRGLLEAGHA